MTPHRRHDDPTPNPDADEAERILASLPTIIPRLHQQDRRLRNLVMFIVGSLVVAGFAIQAVRENDLRQAYRACVDVNQNALRINLFVDAAIDSVRDNPDLSPTEKEFRILRYEALKQKVPVCREPKHPPYNPF
jgi:hypothetical protein